MLAISSPAFSDGGPIPRAHTCDGADLSPPLTWRGVPAGAKQLALIVDDPDAPGRVWVHWVLYGLGASVSGLPAGLAKDGVQGINDFRRLGYGGPCPPPGPAHRYVFTLYTLDTELKLPPGATKDVLLAAMKGHVLEEAKTIAKYGRGARP